MAPTRFMAPLQRKLGKIVNYTCWMVFTWCYKTEFDVCCHLSVSWEQCLANCCISSLLRMLIVDGDNNVGSQ